ncbi:hypothetical protein E2562_009445 [Oryza meyeriana var. granulata]|uniref:Uncharacterized protein n=1 Tax=Oryza meyeriana var. granulata TaxID=110450 RepID=A0A6G1BT45_9ORYZ|nr:hypothetical protein E2562_009445 [Oryza meyeriana var. granulata]
MMEDGGDDGEAADVDAYGRTTRGGKVASCWGRLGLEALWHRLRQLRLARRRRRHGGRSIHGAGGLNYDPLSYAQNFDDGSLEPDFTARFAPPRNASSPRLPSAAPAAATA